jgi:methylmalonyl-CoA mutase
MLVEPLLLFRGSEEYEKLRLSVEKSGKNPVVFLLTIGNPVMRKARAQFSAVFFGCAGYSVIDNIGFATIEEGAKAALEAGTDIIVLCSSDEEYAEHAPELFRIVKDKAIPVIAGNPACSEDLKKLGIEYFIHMKSDVPEILGKFNKSLGIC